MGPIRGKFTPHQFLSINRTGERHSSPSLVGLCLRPRIVQPFTHVKGFPKGHKWGFAILLSLLNRPIKRNVGTHCPTNNALSSFRANFRESEVSSEIPAARKNKSDGTFFAFFSAILPTGPSFNSSCSTSVTGIIVVAPLSSKPRPWVVGRQGGRQLHADSLMSYKTCCADENPWTD
jgi:hypothetical protein